jgi:hypothetical protein
MKKFLVLYRAPMAAFEQMQKATPEQQKAGMEAWITWSKKAGSAIVDMGAPLGKSLSQQRRNRARNERFWRLLRAAGRVAGSACCEPEGAPALHDARRLHRGRRDQAHPWDVEPTPTPRTHPVPQVRATDHRAA